jgi:hypothetical protein
MGGEKRFGGMRRVRENVVESFEGSDENAFVGEYVDGLFEE